MQTAINADSFSLSHATFQVPWIHIKFDTQIHNKKCEIAIYCRKQDRKRYIHKTYCIVSPWQMSKYGSKYWNGASNTSFIITRYMRHCLALSLIFVNLSCNGAIVNSTKPCKKILQINTCHVFQSYPFRVLFR